MSDSPVTTRYEGSLALVTIDSPGTRNALDAATRSAVSEAVVAANDREEVHVLVIGGARGCFATGLEPYPGDQLAVGAASAVAASLKPTVAWIDGDCHDMGLELALACDIRVCSPRARFAMRHVVEGLLPWDGGTQRLARVAGRGQALRLLMTGEEIDADEALRIGLVQLSGEYHDVTDLAKQIARGAPSAARYAKEAALSGADLSLDQGLRLEADLSVLLQSTDDRAEGLRRFNGRSGTERPDPEFRGR